MNHFSKLSTFALLAFTLSATSACESTFPSQDGGSDLQPPSADAFASLAIDARKDLLQSFTMDADNLQTVVGEQGTTITFPWWAEFTHADGSDVTGEITVELIEIFDRGSMLVTNMPTNGRQPNGEPGQLLSAGEHYVNVTQDGESLEVDTAFYLTAPADLTGGVDLDMELFRAETEDGFAAGLEDSNSVWTEANDGNGNCCFDPENPFGGYTWLSNQFGWTNLDRWYHDSRPKTSITVEVPSGWNSTNSAVYLAEDGVPNTLTGLSGSGALSPIFQSGAGRIPVGMEMHAIFVTETNGQWAYSIQALTVEVEDHLDFTSADDLTLTDIDGMSDALNSLP